MQHITIVEHSDASLQMILKGAQAFDKECVLYGILERRYTVYDIQQFIIDVKEYHAKLLREINALTNFSMSFNKRFATENNMCFVLAEKLFRMIRSSVSGTKRIYKGFCKRVQDKFRDSDGTKKASVFTHSALATGIFSRDMFGVGSFPEVVKILCDELESFFTDLIQVIRICQEVSAEEQRILNNPKTLVEIYKSDCEKTREDTHGVIAMIREGKLMNAIDPATKYKNTHSLQVFLRHMFHKLDRNQFTMHIVNTEVTSGRSEGLDELESTIWANHHDLVPKIRIIIEHFDDLEPQGKLDKKSNKYKISGEVLAHFEKWSYLEGTKFEKAFVEDYFNKRYDGECLTVKANTVNTARNKITKAGKDPGYETFEKNVDALLAKYDTSAKSVVKNEEKVVGF